MTNEETFGFHDSKIRGIYSTGASPLPLFLVGMPAHQEEDMLNDFGKCRDKVLSDIEYYADKFVSTETFYCPVMEIWPFGVHYIDALFGCKIRYSDGVIFADKLNCKPGQLQKPDLRNSEIFHKSLELVKFLLNSFENKIRISTPVLSSPLNIAVNILGEDFLSCIIEDKQGAVHALRIITDVIAELHRQFSSISPMVRHYACSFRYTPDNFGHICGCSTHLVSENTYAEVIRPFDEEILSVYPEGGTIHLCGKHVQHIDTFRDMKNLRGVQINDTATDDIEFYLTGLRQDQILYVSPTALHDKSRIAEKTGRRPVVILAES